MSGNCVEICVEICRKDAVLPKYAKPGDAGMDIYAAEEIRIEAGQTAIVPTGLKMAIPEGYEIQVRPRSGISYKTPLRLANSPGTIDSGYRDELGIIITNTSFPQAATAPSWNPAPAPCANPTPAPAPIPDFAYTLDERNNKHGTYVIRKGDRIAQVVLQRLPKMSFKVVDSVAGIGLNRGGGFGSSGIK